MAETTKTTTEPQECPGCVRISEFKQLESSVTRSSTESTISAEIIDDDDVWFQYKLQGCPDTSVDCMGYVKA